MKPAIEALFLVARAIKATRLFGMLAEVAPRCRKALTSSSVGASCAGNMICMGSLHPARCNLFDNAMIDITQDKSSLEQTLTCSAK